MWRPGQVPAFFCSNSYYKCNYFKKIFDFLLPYLLYVFINTFLYMEVDVADERCVFFDIETTSADIYHAEIIEIFALELVDNAPTGKTFHQLIKPHTEIPPEVEQLTGLNKEKLKDKPSFKDIQNSLLEFIGDGDASKANKTVLGAHNFHFDGFILNRHLMSDEPRYELRTGSYLNAVANDRKRNFKTLERDLSKRGGYKLGERNPTTIDTMRIVGQMVKVFHETGFRAGQPKWPSLEESCKVLDVDTSERKQHGAAVDTMLSAECFMASKGYVADDQRRQRTRDFCRPFFRSEENALPQPPIEHASREAGSKSDAGTTSPKDTDASAKSVVGHTQPGEKLTPVLDVAKSPSNPKASLEVPVGLASNDNSGKRKASPDEELPRKRLHLEFDGRDRDRSPGR